MTALWLVCSPSGIFTSIMLLNLDTFSHTIYPIQQQWDKKSFFILLSNVIIYRSTHYY
jgi:hypothetical protein